MFPTKGPHTNMAKTGNDLWWSQVSSYQQQHDCTVGEAEAGLFTEIVRRMTTAGIGMTGIRDHFKDAFDIGKSAFYTRMKKMGVRWVLPVELRKENP